MPTTCSAREFVDRYMQANQPVLLSAECLGTATWGAMRAWGTVGGVKFEGLRALDERLGRPSVAVERARGEARDVVDMPLAAYIDAWESGRAATDKETLYLKDLHVFHLLGEDASRELYGAPAHFGDDWLNAWSKGHGRDYKFAYFGPAGSWTAVHHDVLGSFSWSVNVVGVKRWMLFPPGTEALLRTGPDTYVADVRDEALSRYDPAARERVLAARAAALEFEQRPGEAMFVPACWYHFVWNETDCISINTNFTNAAGIGHVTATVLSRWQATRVALDDVRPGRSDYAFQDHDEWLGQCERVLVADAEMGVRDLLDLIATGLAVIEARTSSVPAPLAAALVLSSVERLHEIGADLEPVVRERAHALLARAREVALAA